MKNIRDNSGFSVVEVLLVLVIVGILSFTGWFVWHANNNAKNYLNSQVNVSKNAADMKNTPIPAKQVSPLTANSPVAQTEQIKTVKTFNFVDMTGWQSREPSDQSFSVKFDTSKTYGTCNNASGVLMIGMVYMNSTGKYDCAGIKDALTKKQVNGSSLILTYIAIGPSEDLWDKGTATAEEVTLQGGQTASRYEYTTDISGTSYDTIEYDVTYHSKSFVAVMHWPSSIDLSSGSYISTNYFDTIVQKTLAFN